jgi:hypothetical protein
MLSPVRTGWLVKGIDTMWPPKVIVEVEHEAGEHKHLALIFIVVIVPPRCAGWRFLCNRVGCDLPTEYGEPTKYTVACDACDPLSVRHWNLVHPHFYYKRMQAF